MTDLSKAPRTRLSTTFGTVLYVDGASREVRHGAIDSSRANAVLVASESPHEGSQTGWLMYDAAGVLHPIVCSGGGCWAASSSAGAATFVTPSPFQIVRLDYERIGLRSGSFYLCAEADGRITLSRTVCSAWESFTPLANWCAAPTATDATNGEGAATLDTRPIRSWTAELMQLSPAKLGAATAAADRRFAARRVVVMRHRGNLANKMVQYMGALTIANRIRDCTIVNVSIPEWGIEIPNDTQDQIFFDNVDLWTWDAFRPHVEELCLVANRSQSIRIMMADHLQRMEFLMHPESYQAIFPRSSHLPHQMTEKDLLINIRTAEILDGIPHYPLLPIAFYEDVVARTGLNPVFVGQLTPSEYVRQLRDRFPKARVIESQGARADFDLIRSAKNIVVAISTFSWLAAWLSEAKTIIVPLSGFYNPAHHREIDLLPVDDIRYRYFLFPLNYGLPEKESLQHHEWMKGHWKEISRNQVALLKSASPFLRVPRENYYNGLPATSARGAAITFDSIWYAHRYIDAAMEISEGWFEDPLHHYLEVGKLRGYLPTPPIQDEFPIDITLPNIAINKRAIQSSLSKWSKGRTLEADATNAVNGDPSKDYGFHTDNDPPPWWMVDLGNTALVHFIRIFNRDLVPDWIQRRASPLTIEASVDGEQWNLLLRTQPGHLFGGYSGGRPLVWSTKDLVEARFVRVSIPRQEFLHLAEVEIYGKFSDEQIERI
jgi:hypothetical protein